MNILLAIFAYTVLVGFLGIMVWHVPRFDLGIWILFTLLLVGYDFFFHREKTDVEAEEPGESATGPSGD